jgi:hypothetical protein
MAPEITHAPGFTETRPKLCVCCLPSKATSTRAVVVRGLNTPCSVHPAQIIEDVIRLRAAMKPYFSAQLDMLNATGRPFNRKYNAISITEISHQMGGRLIIFRALCAGPLMWDFPHDPQTWILAEKGIGDGGGGPPPPPSTSLTNGDFVVLAECNSSDATQQWKLDPETNNLQLTANTKFCLDCGGTNPKVHMWTCSHQWHNAQAWSYNPQTKALEDSRRGGACLTTGGDSAKVGLSGAGSSCAQWTFSGAMSGSVKAAGGKCLAVTQQTGGGGGATGVIDQYMMGDDYMAAPVLNLGQRARNVYFPVGADWTHHYTSKVYKGGTTQSVEAPLSTFPLFRRTPDGSGWLKKDTTLSEELETQLTANQSHLYFYWVNKAADRCGEVDAAPYMPKDLFEPSHKLALLGYIEATISLFGVKGGPQPGDLKLGRCKDHGFAVDGHQEIGSTWTPMDLQGPICMKHCKCQWWDTHGNPVSGYKPAAAAGLHNCTDVPDDPATGHFCSLCGPSTPGNCGGERGACSIGIAIWRP